MAVNPKYTSQNCSMCGQTVVKSLSTRTHKFPHCGYTVDGDENARLNILILSLKE
ncbi:zinc ribbon domain-containing protein [Microcoleus sp. F4-D5]|uniref:zinc ribbon domain-containing protein n=1 Tax=Microcoleus sp. F4-D5 TaxID=2818760 RepID=UPI004040A5EC